MQRERGEMHARREMAGDHALSLIKLAEMAGDHALSLMKLAEMAHDASRLVTA